MPLAQIDLSGDVPKFKEKLQYNGELAWSNLIGSEDQFGIGWQNAQPNLPIENIHLRSERQILRRLPRSRAILFTIRPYFISIVEIAKEASIPGRLASAIRGWSDDISIYKGEKAYADVILKCLDQKHQEQCDNSLDINHSNFSPF
ncbi:unnamed protein product [Rotaria sp. Silwood2]|nr:unnamed protein product [Rotaria sp. Silwood2]